LLLLSCILEGSISVLKWHGDIYDGNRLAGFIDCDEVESERLFKARYRLADSKPSFTLHAEPDRACSLADVFYSPVD